LHEQRQEMLKQMGQTINSAKDSVRAGRTEGMNSLGGRRADGANDVQKLADEYGGQLDTLLSQAKKEFEKA
jgi:ribosome recycling factor